MVSWENASSFEKKQLEVISRFLSHRPNLVKFLFEATRPRLTSSPESTCASIDGLF